MIADWSHIAVTPGTRRSERLAEPLMPGYFRLEDRTLDKLVALLGDLARTIRFVAADGQAGGTWRKLFEQEQAFVLAEVLSMPLEARAAQFEADLIGDWRKATAQLSDFAAHVQRLVTRLAPLGQGPFARQIAHLESEEQLSTRLGILSSTNGVGLVRAIRAQGFMGQRLTLEAPRDALAEAQKTQAELRAAHGLLINTVAALRPTARRAFEARLVSRDIDPAFGLLLAELRAADLVTERMTTITERFIQYYYRDVLGQSPRPAPQERVLLSIPPNARPQHLPKGAGILARLGDQEHRFETEAAIQVIPAQVTARASLRYDCDKLNSFNAGLDGITGIRAELRPTAQAAPARRVFSPDTAARFEVGLDIASPMLWLAEGQRMIEVEFAMNRSSDLVTDDRSPGPTGGSERAAATEARRKHLQIETDLDLALRADPELVAAFGFRTLDTGIKAMGDWVRAYALRHHRLPSLALLYEALSEAVLTPSGLRFLLGRIVTAILIEGLPLPSGRSWDLLSRKIKAAGPALSGQYAQGDNGEVTSLVDRIFMRSPDPHPYRHPPGDRFDFSRSDLFEILLGDAFRLSLSTADGPFSPQITRILPNGPDRPAGLTIRLRLDPADPPIVAPPGEVAPVLSLRLSSLARTCPQSILETYAIGKLRFVVEARGLRRVAAFSDEGPLDAGQSFTPFGQRPRDGSSLAVALPEMAIKPVAHAGIALGWAELPGEGLGFAAHYAQYDPAAERPKPVVRAEYLSADGWKPLGETAAALFAPTEDGTRLSPGWALSGDVQGNSVPASGALGPLPTARGGLRAGAVRLTLHGSEGFLADRHPAALVRAMRPRLLERKERPMPRTPFVPRANFLSLDYVARKTMALNAPQTATTGERIVQISPFGRTEVYPRRVQREIGFLPARLGYGAHFVQIDGAGALGPVSLLFDIDESGHGRIAGPLVPVDWHYLTAAGWRRLPETAIFSDTTNGLMRSGVVALDLPDDAVRSSDEMPGNGQWIAVSASSRDLDSFPVLRDVRTNGVWARRVAGEGPALGAGRRFQFEPARQGIAAPTALALHTTLLAPEDDARFKARVSERLRHRQRAITPWDYERLVLEAFPEVWMIKCLPHLDRRTTMPRPGHVTLVVVPEAPPLAPDQPPTAQLFDALTLRRIQDFLVRLAPPGARIQACNPSFERLQLRGKVRFTQAQDDGALTQRLKTDMARYLSVWTAPRAIGRFGWSINPGALHAHIRDLDYVRHLTDFSLLHLVEMDQGRYVLHDTAILDPRARGHTRITAAEPWALPLSAPEHILTSILDDRDDPALPTGIGGLRLGEMLIVN